MIFFLTPHIAFANVILDVQTRNGLMFSPDADESPYHPPPIASSSELNVTEGIAQPKSISYTSTRLPSPPAEPSNLVPPSPTRSRIDAAISGLPYRPSFGEGEGGAAGPHGYNYVPTVPSPSPDQLGPTALNEPMKMGSLLATPRLLSSTRTGEHDIHTNPEATPFRINPPSRREQTGLKLSIKSSRSIRGKAALFDGGSRTPRTKGDMAPPPGATSPRRSVGDLTPAARALLARNTGGKGVSTPLRGGDGGVLFDREREGSVVERDLRKVKWTPSPMSRR
jgi:protein DGCR14